MEAELSKLLIRVDMYENSLQQLKRELPVYVQSRTEANSTKKLTKVLRYVASNEYNQELQSLLFFCAQKYESIEAEKAIFLKCEEQSTNVLADAKQLLISPYKEVLMDFANCSKGSAADAISNREYHDAVLPIHTAMFDQHRMQSIKKLLAILLRSELKFHCKAVEELSSVLQALGKV